MKLTLVTAATGLVLVAAIVELLRRRQLREKYSILWLLVGLIVIPLALFPGAFDHFAHLMGIASGLSLVFFFAVVFLLLVCIHLSWEVSRLEEETRILAEEIALIRAELREIDHRLPSDGRTGEDVTGRIPLQGQSHKAISAPGVPS